MVARRDARWVGGGLAALLALGAAPAVARAHAVDGSRFDAPLPPALLFAGAGAAVALTALGLALVGRVPSGRRRVLTVPARIARPLRRGAAAGFLIVALAAAVAGIVGRQVAAANPATLFVWPVWVRGLALVAVLVGSPWLTLSPWRTVYRLLVRIEGREVAALGGYPARLGAWPAVVGFLALVAVETLTVVPRSPRLTAALLAAYGLAMVAGAACFGSAWLRRADPLGVLYRLLGRVAVVDLSRTDDGGWAVAVRPPWRGCLAPLAHPSLVAVAVAAVYTVSFDGFVATRPFQTALFAARGVLGTGAGTSVLLYALGFGGFLVTFGVVCWAVERLGAATRDATGAAGRFAPTLLPIAAAYEVAHNYPYVLRNLGRLVAVAARPVVPGARPVEPLGWLSLPAFWGSQVALIVLGHAVAVVAAHAVAVDRYGPDGASRGHLPLVALMVGYTVLSLWIVSRPVVSGVG